MKKVAIYIRVSTTEQSLEGYSIPAQKEKLLSYCKAKDWLVVDIFIDGGYSGANLERPGLNSLLNNLNNIDLVLVYKLDRLSRSQKDTLFLIEDKFISNNIDFVSITENFDTSSPFGRAMIGVLSVFAQLERENIMERTKMGRIERAKKGLWVGTPRPPVGYDLIDSNLIVNEYEAMQIKEIFDLYIKGYGLLKIQNVFKKKGYTTKYGDWSSISNHAIVRIITNRTYLGEISYAKEWYDGIHIPIIDKETFEQANLFYEERKGTARNLKYFLSGLLYCECCGGKYISDTKNNKPFFICENRKLAYKRDIKCTNTLFDVVELERIAVEKIKYMVLNKEEAINNKFKQLKPKENNDTSNNKLILNRIKEIEKQIEKLMDLYQLDTIPLDQLSARIEKLHEEKKNISKSIVPETTSSEKIGFKEILDMLDDFDSIWNELDSMSKKEIASILLGNKILVRNTGI